MALSRRLNEIRSMALFALTDQGAPGAISAESAVRPVDAPDAPITVLIGNHGKLGLRVHRWLRAFTAACVSKLSAERARGRGG